MSKKICFVVNEKDNVATILKEDLKVGTKLEVKLGENSIYIELQEKVKYGHKVAITPIKNGEKIIKYGLTIGLANKDIKVGEHVHTHNVESIRGRGDLVGRR